MKHRRTTIIPAFVAGKIASYMYFDNGIECPHVGCKHGWRISGRSANVSSG